MHPQHLKQTGILYVVATPIGNLEDITLRAIRILGDVDVIAAEDTRHTRKLLSHLDISKPLISYYKDKEVSRADLIINRLLQGENVALVSDAGTPGISDPGHIITRQALEAGLRVVPIPGPSALTTALSVAGLTTNNFLFLGFLPSKSSERKKLLSSLLHTPYPIVFYESPHRFSASLKDCFDVLGDRQVFWGRELTKLYEEMQRSTLALLVKSVHKQKIRGESVLIIDGAEAKEKIPTEDIEELLSWYKSNSDLSLKDAVQRVTTDLGLPRSAVYRKALSIWK